MAIPTIVNDESFLDESGKPLSNAEIRIVNALRINKQFCAKIEPHWSNIALMQEAEQTQQTLVNQLLRIL